MHGTLLATPRAAPEARSRLAADPAPRLARIARRLAGLRHLSRLHRARRRGDRRRVVPVALAHRGHRPRGPPDSRRRHGVLPAPAGGEPGRTRVPGGPGTGRHVVARHARHGDRRREGLGARGDEGGRRHLSRGRRLSRPIRSCRRPSSSPSANGAFGAVADPALLARLDLKVGDRVTVGDATIELRAQPRLRARQDRRAASASGRACWCRRRRWRRPASCSRAAWCAGPIGSSCRRRSRPMQGSTADRGGGRAGFCPRPAGTSARASMPIRALPRNIERFTQFLTLVGPHGAARRRRRRRQCGARLRRPQARLHRHPEEPRRAGRPGGGALPDAGDG